MSTPQSSLTPFQVKELLIERCEHAYAEHIVNSGSSTPIDLDKTYSKLAVLDLTLHNPSRANLQNGNDMTKTLWDLGIEHLKLKVGSEKLLFAMKDPEFRNEVTQLVDAEAWECNPRNTDKEDFEKLTQSTKILRIINNRLEKSIVRVSRSKKAMANIPTQFFICAARLVDGDGSHCQYTKMHIDQSTPFEEFLSKLRIESQFCRMPEKYPPPFDDVPPTGDLASDSSTAPAYSSQPMAHQDSQASTRTAETMGSDDTWFTTYTSHTLQGDEHGWTKEHRRLPGFTLADGPWMYFVAYREEGKERTELAYLANKDDYDKMVKLLTSSDTENCAVITHSRERERHKIWLQEVEEEEADQARLRKLIRDHGPFEGGPFHDFAEGDEIGEDVMIAMRKKNNRSAALWDGRVFQLF
ncbi:hypothetical protein PVAG01_11420 [Phlyctema vagabunda]|uniref:Uncharacterized protein n=1 Tax=Phlyctema vagabunda TaxID=108571 RepID=A0ABR4P284_9HELO